MHAASRIRPTRPEQFVPRMLGIAFLTLPALIGCGDGGPTRQAVAGLVTLDGKPLPAGSIVFAPLDGQTAAVGEVKEGTYRIAPASGPAPGRYQVEVRAEAPTGKRVPHPDLPGETIEEVRELIPQRYNARTELTADVKTDGENAFDFELTSREPRTRARR